MANNINAIVNTLAPTSVGSIYTTPANVKSVIQKFIATSQEASAARLLTIYFVAPAGTPGATNIVVDKVSIPPAVGRLLAIPSRQSTISPQGHMSKSAVRHLKMSVIR